MTLTICTPEGETHALSVNTIQEAKRNIVAWIMRGHARPTAELVNDEGENVAYFNGREWVTE